MTEPAAPEAAPKAASESVSEAKPKAASESVSEAKPGAASESVSEAAPEATSETASEEISREPTAPAPQAPSRLRRLAPFVLLAGAAISAMSILPYLPRERRLELRFEEPSTIVGVHLDWTASTAPGDEPIQGSTWRFAPGSAPRLLPATVRLPNGSYDIDIRVDRVDQTQTVHRSITLGDADRITVPVR